MNLALGSVNVFTLTDVGGQKAERENWETALQGAHAIIYRFCSLSIISWKCKIEPKILTKSL